MLIGLWNYLAPPRSAGVSVHQYTFSKLDTNGFYFNDGGNASGILFLAIGCAYRLPVRHCTVCRFKTLNTA
ncbi:MAG: hypothetical protein ACLTXT_05085 [Ruminococcus callidus]